MSGFRKLVSGLAISLVFGMAAHAERYKVHKDAGAYGICIRTNDNYRCDGDVAERAVLISADEVEALVQSARDYCKNRFDPETAQLRTEVRHLADANDVLSKRVSDLEAKLAAQTKQAPKKP